VVANQTGPPPRTSKRSRNVVASMLSKLHTTTLEIEEKLQNPKLHFPAAVSSGGRRGSRCSTTREMNSAGGRASPGRLWHGGTIHMNSVALTTPPCAGYRHGRFHLPAGKKCTRGGCGISSQPYFTETHLALELERARA
jgi:hypothetical protein